MKKTFLLMLALGFVAFHATGQSFYDVNKIQKIEIQFGFNNWDFRMDTAKDGSESYTIAQWIKVNGVRFDSVGVKFKGFSSYDTFSKKNPLHIELNTIKNQAYQGYTDFKLANLNNYDPSMVREVTAYKILESYTEAPKANFAQVYINGKMYGLFTNVENVNKDFTDSRFGSSNGALIKAALAKEFLRPNPGAPPVDINSSLEYFGTDIREYAKRYEGKPTTALTELREFCDSLNNRPTSLPNILDVDRAIWMLAFNNVFLNLDSYTLSTRNYYLYKDKTKRFLPIFWDLNMAFGAYDIIDFIPPFTPVLADEKFSLFYNANNPKRPMVSKILSVPTYRKMYVAHAKTMIEDWLVNGKYNTETSKYAALIDTAVLSDTNRLTSYADFKKNLRQDIVDTFVVPTGDTLFFKKVGVQKIMQARVQYFMTTSEFFRLAPVISNIQADNAIFNQNVAIKAKIQNGKDVLLKYRFENLGKFETAKMFDDGVHNDGAANDGVYGAAFLMANTMAQYFIYAENDSAGAFSPQRAEHEFYTLNAAPLAPITGVVINEFMASNVATVKDSSGQFDDWIELFNKTNAPINLTGVYLSDEYTNRKKWQFPANTTIPANGYLIVWADNDETQAGVHANFKLSAAGEQIVLSNPDSSVVDSVRFGAQRDDISWGRFPNGTGAFGAMRPTFKATNARTAVKETISEAILLSPNPTSKTLNITFSAEIGALKIEIINVLGSTIHTFNATSQSASLDVSDLPTGLYVVKFKDEKGRVKVDKFMKN
jgi:hypothetical protein